MAEKVPKVLLVEDKKCILLSTEKNILNRYLIYWYVQCNLARLSGYESWVLYELKYFNWFWVGLDSSTHRICTIFGSSWANDSCLKHVVSITFVQHHLAPTALLSGRCSSTRCVKCLGYLLIGILQFILHGASLETIQKMELVQNIEVNACDTTNS